jgi:hypothetical protein
MKLPQPFIRLPLRFDAARLQQELATIPAESWSKHPTGYKGNTAARLITVGGEENDNVAGGAMRPTPLLARLPYIQQILAGFGVVWSRSRLMKLAPGAVVPEHIDINYHWFTRVRLHIPIQTWPEVLFYCGKEVVHMAPGEAWLFDNWRPHKVENNSDQERVHLVADTTGSSAFWQLAAAGSQGQAQHAVPYQPGRPAQLLTERFTAFRVMPPAELDSLLSDLAAENSSPVDDAAGRDAVAHFNGLLEAFCNDWRQMWMLHADADSGVPGYNQMLDAFRDQAAAVAGNLRVRSNRQPIMRILNARLEYAVNESEARIGGGAPPAPAVEQSPRPSRFRPRLERPVFIVAAPRSGSTLLFETLACTPQLWTVGGEAHWLVEGFPQLQPGAPGIDSNRIGAEQATPEIAEAIGERLAEALRDGARRRLDDADDYPIRFLEKTPKNALRIPFFDKLFPDALFVYLWRDPRENISSIMEAWRSDRWVTYPRLDGWDGPWSLMLPPGWRELRGKPLADVGAFQWDTANRIILDDLGRLDRARWLPVRYADVTAAPRAAVQRICAFAGLEFDAELEQRISLPLPLSRNTKTAPDPDKWRSNGTEIERVLPGVAATWRRLQAL